MDRAEILKEEPIALPEGFYQMPQSLGGSMPFGSKVLSPKRSQNTNNHNHNNQEQTHFKVLSATDLKRSAHNVSPAGTNITN